MDADKRRLEMNDITEKIIKCAYTIGNKLGSGFLEKVYENALSYEIRKNNLKAAQQYSMKVYYDDIEMGDYVADLLVEDVVLVEIKAVKILDEIHMAQCLNYLKATGLKICLLINFGQQKVQIKRIVNNF